MTATRAGSVPRDDVPRRRDWRRAIAESGVPMSAQQFVVDVVSRTRLWRRERAAVADELIAHFADAIAAGTSADDAVGAFGDPRAAARLIRRAKRRQRPIAWHAMSVIVRATLVLFAIYGVVLVRYLSGTPSVRVNYAMQIAGDVGRVPEVDRAWPLYRQAIAMVEVRRTETLDEPLADQGDGQWVRTVSDATPADAEWPRLGAWLDAQADVVALARAGAAKRAIGLPFDDLDPEVRANRRPLSHGVFDLGAVIGLSRLSSLLELDARFATGAGDGPRVEADLVARLDITDQQRAEPLAGGGLINDDDLTLRRLERALCDRPAMFGDAALVRLAHRVSRIGGDTASSIVDLRPERLTRLDTLQRLYTDDGRGDGRLTPDGVRSLVGPMRPGDRAAAALVGGAISPFASRAAERERLDSMIATAEARLARPLRELVAAGIDSTGEDLDVNANPAERRAAYLFPFAVQNISFGLRQIRAEQLLGRRDGLLVGLALEVYRRRHGELPATLDALVPTLLPHVPVDRISGDPLRYRVVDGAAVVYSVGVDRDDDAGRAPVDGDGNPSPRDAAFWQWTGTRQKMPDGDWTVFDGRPRR